MTQRPGRITARLGSTRRTWPHKHTCGHTFYSRTYPQCTRPRAAQSPGRWALAPSPSPGPPGSGWPSAALVTPGADCVIMARRCSSAGGGLKCGQLQRRSRRSRGCERPGRERAEGGCSRRERRDRCVVALSPGPALLQQAAGRSAPPGPLPRAPGFPLRDGPGSCRRGGRAFSLPGRPGCGRFPLGEREVPVGSVPRAPEGHVESLALALRQQACSGSSWCWGQSVDR